MSLVCGRTWSSERSSWISSLPRVEVSDSLPVNHVCNEPMNHIPPCKCSCTAILEIPSKKDTRIPEAGTPLGFEDLEMICSAVLTRQENFPDEPFAMTIALVMANIGDRFAPVTCINGEWEGIKADFPPGHGVPKCPNGHVCTQGEGLKLGWVSS